MGSENKKSGLEPIGASQLKGIPADVLAEVTAGVAALYGVIPIKREEGVLVVASSDPESIAENFERLIGKEVRWVVADKKDISKALARCYPAKATLEEALARLEPSDFFPEPIPKVPKAREEVTTEERLAELERRVLTLEMWVGF